MLVGVVVFVGGYFSLCGWECWFVWVGMVVCVGGYFSLCGWVW